MLKKSIIFLDLLLLSIMLLSPAALAAEADGVAGTVPYLLTAKSTHDSMYQECTLGDALSDAAVRYTGAELAIINGGDLTGNLPPGEITEAELEECIAEDKALAVASVTPVQLREILESALSHVTTDGNRAYDIQSSPHPAFPQVSGFRVSYDPEAEPGCRIARITVNDEALELTDSSTVFTLAATVDMLRGAYGLPAVGSFETSDLTLRSILRQYMRDGMDEYIMPAKRIYAMEIRSGLFANRYAIFTIVAVCILFFVLLIPFGKKLSRANRQNREHTADKGEKQASNNDEEVI